MKHVYLAHPVGAPTPAGIADNLTAARRWYRYFCDRFNDHAFMMNWMINVAVYDEEHRAMGMMRNLAQVELCSELWLCGPRISNGMLTEAIHAREKGLVIRDFTPIEGSEVRAIDMLPTTLHDRLWRKAA